MTLSTYLLQHHNIQTQTMECLKDLDTLVFKVTDVLGNIYSIKLYKKNKRDLVNKLHEIALFLEYLQDFKLQTSNPKLHASKELQTPNSDLETYHVVISKWIEGNTLKSITVPICRKIGTILATLHDAAASFEPTLSLQHIDSALMPKIQALILQSSLGVFLEEEEKKQLKETFFQVQQKLNEVGYEKKDYGLIHSDLHFANWLQQGKQLIPIDFDEMAYGHYLTDIAVVFAEIDDFSSKKAEKLKKAFLEGYKTRRALPSTFLDDFVFFEYVAAALYLNWACHPNHTTILEHPRKRYFAEITLKKLMHG